MISTEHGFIRGAEPDDAPGFHRLYEMERPRAALLDARREPMMPTVSELRELLGNKESVQGSFFAVEDREGEMKGFCTLRGFNAETSFADAGILFFEEDQYKSPLAGEVLAFVLRRAFERLRMNKVMAHCLDSEKPLRRLLTDAGFESGGVQREVFFGGGRWADLESLALHARAWRAQQAHAATGS